MNQLLVNDLLSYATEFNFGVRDVGQMHGLLVISRQKSGWFVTMNLGPINPWNLADDMVWRYKVGTGFKTPQDAVDAFNRALTRSTWSGH
jgi:hypothetical protein